MSASLERCITLADQVNADRSAEWLARADQSASAIGEVAAAVGLPRMEDLTVEELEGFAVAMLMITTLEIHLGWKGSAVRGVLEYRVAAIGKQRIGATS